MLAEMGIPVWRLRTGPVFRYQIVLDPQEMDQLLFSNILKAIGCKESESKVLRVNDPSSLTRHSWENSPILVFGQQFYPYVPDSAVQTLSLTELNNNLPAKKALWQKLKS